MGTQLRKRTFLFIFFYPRTAEEVCIEAIEMMEIGGKNGGLDDKMARCRLDILAKAYLVLHCVKDVDVAEVV